MWIKRPNNTGVFNLGTGHGIVIRPVDDTRGLRTFDIVSHNPSAGGEMVVADGYTTADEARSALEDFLKRNNIKAVGIEKPESKTETTEDR